MHYYSALRKLNTIALPSHIYEAWGLVINEAMFAVLQVLVSNICGCSLDLVREYENRYLLDSYFKYVFPADQTYLTRFFYKNNKNGSKQENNSLVNWINLSYFEYIDLVKI